FAPSPASVIAAGGGAVSPPRIPNARTTAAAEWPKSRCIRDLPGLARPNVLHPAADLSTSKPFTSSGHRRGRVGALPRSFAVRRHLLSVRDTLTNALGSQYRIERELGRGRFATVFLAQDCHSG